MRRFLLLLSVVLAMETGVRAEESSSARGRGLYLLHCARCHGPEGRGDGPDAALLADRPVDLRKSEALHAYPDETLVEKIRGTRRLRLEFRAESLSRQAADAEFLYRFLSSLPATLWKRVAEGERIYFERCVSCHGSYGRPQPPLPKGVAKAPRDLADPDVQSSVSDEELEKRVRHGGHGMPALVPRLTVEEARQVAAFVRRLSPGYVLFEQLCAVCHGRRGEGATGALEESRAPRFAFDERYFERHDPMEVRQKVWHMLDEHEPAMPHFAELSGSEVRAILDHLRSLPPPGGR